MPDKRTEQILTRVTSKMKVEINDRCIALGTSPQKYIISLIEKDLVSNASKLPESEKHFIETTIAESIKDLSINLTKFMSDNVDYKLDRIMKMVEPKGVIIERMINSMVTLSNEKKVRLPENIKNQWRDGFMKTENIYGYCSKIREQINQIARQQKEKKSS